jgi:hypothetical protein
MADVTVAPASVAPYETNEQHQPYDGVAFEAIEAGEICYYDSTTEQMKKMDADVAVARGTRWGVALNTAEGQGQPLVYAIAGEITISAAGPGTVGDVVVASSTAGKMAPAADLASAANLYYVGVFVTSNVVKLLLQNPGIVKP